MINQLNNNFFTKEDLSLFESAAIFSFCQVLKTRGMENQMATFDLFVRDMPKNRNFLLFGGLEEIINGIINWKFNKEDVAVLLNYGLIKEELAKYLEKFKFTGSVMAMKEGTVFFPNEPIIRITAPIIEANILFMFLINAVSSNTIFMSKAARSVLAAKGKPVFTNGGRAQGFEAGAKFVRSAYIAGLIPALQLSPLLKYKIPLPEKIIKSTFHSYIKAFPSELEAMMAFVEEFPDDEATLIVDTYDFEKGIMNAIKVCEHLKKKNKKIFSIFIDSGDLYGRTCRAREKLNSAGFSDVKIMVASNLNEWRVKGLMDKKIPCDSFMAITELATSYDDPKLEIVYKMCQLQDGDKIRQTMKLAPGKKSYPGVKQVFRTKEEDVFKKDIIGLENEKINGEKLLEPIIKEGKLAYDLPHITDIKKYAENQLKFLPDEYKRLETQSNYPVEISNGLSKLTEYTESKMV
ncbi:MAG: nicotinate phosphoribosyltransferase [bacterium]